MKYTLVKIGTIKKKRKKRKKIEECGRKVQREAVCFHRDKEKEREIGELNGDMRKHRLMRKKKWDLKKRLRQPFGLRRGCSILKLL